VPSFLSLSSSAIRAEPLITVLSPGKLYFRQQLAHLELDQLEQLGVVHIRPCSCRHQRRYADLAGEQDVLAVCASGRRPPTHQDGAVHWAAPVIMFFT